MSNHVRMIRREDRNFAMRAVHDSFSADRYAATITKRQKAILLELLAAIRPGGDVAMTNRATLKTSANMMQELFYSGLVNGAGTRDDRGTGNTPASSWWWLTMEGEQVALAIGRRAKS